jgi:hypothetical protein
VPARSAGLEGFQAEVPWLSPFEVRPCAPEHLRVAEESV